MLFITLIIDLQPIGHSNHMTTYADDCSCWCLKGSDVHISLEFQHILKWAGDNTFSVNMSKTKEIVFHHPTPPRNYLPHAEIRGIETVVIVKLLGV